eukprot:Mycagemm_TRINITY_DN10360_c1_g3::TRINITY_DN10360_c1_g3_i2::g.1273::m.1273 type:complete len:117 gc:universal TRINITY_DN10360_c1_g3_i2:1041-691(-)
MTTHMISHHHQHQRHHRTQQEQQQQHQQQQCTHTTTTKTNTRHREICAVEEDAESASSAEGAVSGPKRGDYICSINYHNRNNYYSYCSQRRLLGCFVGTDRYCPPRSSLPHDALCV